MEHYKQQLLEQLKELQKLKETRNGLDDVLNINFEIGVVQEQLRMIEKEERCN